MIEYLDDMVGYLVAGIEILRSFLIRIVGVLPLNEQSSLTIVLLILSFYLGYLLVRRFVVRPLSTSYVIYYSIISFLIFLILNYL